MPKWGRKKVNMTQDELDALVLQVTKDLEHEPPPVFFNTLWQEADEGGMLAKILPIISTVLVFITMLVVIFK